MPQPLVTADHLTYAYGNRVALKDVGFHVQQNTLFGMLGPNGSGKTTLFRLLSTLIPIQAGILHIDGFNVATQQSDVRRRIGVTFQSPAVDVRLTVDENLQCHAALYGLGGQSLRDRIDQLLQQFELIDRRRTIVSQLSGGLKRRVELAKGLLHSPSLLLLDEPTNGLDPRARQEFWSMLRDQMREHGTTVIVATHLMPEAELCGQLMLLDRGVAIAVGTPLELQNRLSGERLTVRLTNPAESQKQIESSLGLSGVLEGDRLTMRVTRPAEQVSAILSQFANQVLSLEFTKPSLEDVFMDLTGRSFEAEESGP